MTNQNIRKPGKLKKSKKVPELDIYQFINSKDICLHLRDIKYEFEPVCAAFIIWQSKRHSLKEKHEAWKTLIASTPDVAVPKRRNCAGWDSLHKMLSDYMELENKLLSSFNMHDSRAWYKYKTVFPPETGDFVQVDGYPWSLDYTICYKAALEDIKEDPDICGFSITKYYFDSPLRECWIRVEYDRDGHIMSVNDYLPVRDDFPDLVNIPHLSDDELKLETESFEGMYFDIPIPFKKYDLVYDPYCSYIWGTRPFILMQTVPWYKKEKNYSNGTTSDVTDMLAYGYCYDSEKHFLCNMDSYYLDMEYFGGKLTGEERLLAAHSAFGKKEIDEYTLMLLKDLYTSEAKVESLKRSLSFLNYSADKNSRLMNETILT